MVLQEQIKRGESKILEFKEILPSSEKIAKSIISFSNTSGGKIIIGITNEGKIKGLSNPNPAEYTDRIANIVHDMIHPVLLPEIYTYEIEEKTVVIIEVYQSNTKPHFLKSKGKLDSTYIRVGTTNKKADYDYIQELERQRLNISYDEEINRSYECNKPDIENLIKILNKNLEKTITYDDLLNFKLIKNENKTDYFTNAALIIMGKLEYARIRCARFKGDSMDIFIDQKDLVGDIFEQLEKAMAFLLFNINLHGELGPDHLRRIDKYEIPVEALREIVINALLHRDYVISGSDIKIAVFDNTVEITSPGAFPGGITIEDILRGRSEIRNRVLARIFREAELIEQWGRGVRRIINQCEEYGLKTPVIKESGMFVQFTLFRNNLSLLKEEKLDYNRTQKSDAKVGRKSRTQKSDANLLKYSSLDINSKKVLNYLSENEYINVRLAMELLGLAKSRASQILNEMVKKGLIERIGSGKTVKYINIIDDD
jgi:ATP-dependent DNA helicase RecG